MNAQILIENIVRQTTVLIAQLATSGGVRAPVAQVANQVFLELARELELQGVSRKVSADMFGLALRSYRRRIQRLEASLSERGRSLWEAMLDFIGENLVVRREELFRRFRHDDESLVRAVLHDLCESGLIFKSGTGRNTAYRAATTEELRELRARDGGSDELVWILIYREGPLDRAELSRLTSLESGKLDSCLASLQADGRIQRAADGRYTSQTAVLPLGTSAGWEAGMFDHFQAMVKTMCARLRDGGGSAPETGGSTYSFNIWPGHPLESEVRGALRAFRAKHTELRERVQAYNASHDKPPHYDKVVVYGGQCVIAQEREESDANDSQ